MKVLVEDKETMVKKFADESPCLCFNIRKASRAITQIYDEKFRHIGLTVTQGSILFSLKMIGSMTISQLSEAMSTDRTTITRNIKPLERDGYIKIRPGQDKRAKAIEITSKGIETTSKAIEIIQELMSNVYGKLGKDRIEKLCSDLSSVMDDIKRL